MVKVEEIIEELNPEFQKNGADLKLLFANEEEVTIGLNFSDDACMDCILPGAMIEQGVERYLRQQGVELRVTVIDPRVAGDTSFPY